MTHPWDVFCRAAQLPPAGRAAFLRRLAREIPLVAQRGPVPPLATVWQLNVHQPGFAEAVVRAAEVLG